jgi:hypothetical protein
VREVISNTSPLQYLFQAELLDLLPALYGTVVVPSGVVDELAEGRALGLALPDPKTLPWVRVRVMADAALLRIAADLDRGEREVLALAKQAADPLAIRPPVDAQRVRSVFELGKEREQVATQPAAVVSREPCRARPIERLGDGIAALGLLGAGRSRRRAPIS